MAVRRTGTDWVVDIAAFAFALGVGLIVLITTRDAHGAVGWLVDLAVGLVALVAMWWRRRHPAALGVVIGLLSIVSALAAGPAVVVTFTATVRSAPRPLAAVWAVAVVAAVTFPLVYPSEDSYAVEIVFGVLFLAVVFGWGLYTRARHQLLLSLRERADSLEAEQGLRVEQARAAERRRIAREMHDVLAHRLSLLSLHAGALEYRADASPDEVAQAAGVIRDASHAALVELREVIGVLREGDDPPATAPPQPTLEQVGALVDEARAAGDHVTLSLDLAPETIPSETIGRTAYRIVQEGLTNARKHAPGAAVTVTIAGTTGETLVVTVASRPPVGSLAAAPPPPGAGTGLVGLRERVALAGGSLESGWADADAPGDFVLRAVLPWTAP
jgi:signal transduction histidine kinase